MSTIHRDLTYVVAPAHPRQRLDLHLPETAPRPLPVLLWLHGGSWKEGDKSTVPLLGLCARGVAVASANYRYLDQAPFPAQINDVKAALRFLRANAERHGLDPARVVAAGFSAGGYLAALAGCAARCDELDDRALGNAACSAAVMGVAAFGTPIDLPGIGTSNGTILTTDAELASLANPLHHLGSGTPRFYIQHGADDDVVSSAHALKLAAALDRRGIAHVLDVVPEMRHKIKLNQEVLDRVAALFVPQSVLS